MDPKPSLEPICEVIVTGPRTSLMQSMIENLLEERLVACGQRFDWVHSAFLWDGKVEHQREERVCFHTRAALFEELAARIERLHPYEVPCILSLSVQAASPAYHRWVLEETKEPG